MKHKAVKKKLKKRIADYEAMILRPGNWSGFRRPGSMKHK